MAALRFLFPIDGSDETYRAVARGLERAGGMKDVQATFLVVLDKRLRSMPVEAKEYLEFDDEDQIFLRPDEAKSALDKAVAIAKKAKFNGALARTVEGDVFDVIVEESKRHDVLVMHRFDPDEAREKRRGSLLEKIARNASCDVWLVRTG